MANRRFIDFPIASTVGDNDIVLIWQDGLNKQTTKGTLIQGAPTSLEGLTDVDIAGLINGQILQYNSVTGKWENVDRTDINLSQLGDVSIVSPSNGQVLVYNSTTSKWENSSAGFVPYTGAVTTVNLGAQTIQAGSFVKQGGTSAQFLKADGSVDSTAYGTGSVTSVGLTMPSAFNVGSSPITTNGTLAVTGAGTTAQYVRGDGSLATFPALTGFVPYTGATADVNLGTHDLTAERGTFENNGSSDTLTVNHTSGSGKGINVSKGGNGEALLVTKTSGSGNAMAVVGGRTALVDLSLSSVSNATGNFLTISGGVVHQRTPSETRSDVGAQAQLNGTGFVKASGTTISYDNSTYQVTSEKAQPNGYASLDSNGKVPLVQINDALIGNVNFQGLWNASTNTPTLANPPASGTKGHYYIVSTAGTFASISFEVGDWIISDGTAWGKVDNTDAVSSVFGRTGNVTATNGDYNTSQVTENTNLYYTEARVNANANVAANTAARHNAVTLGTANGLSLSTQVLSLQLATSGQNGALSSTDWTTFNNKENAITAGTTAQYFRGDKTFQTLNTGVVPESGNLYFTNARAIASVLTGYTSGAGTISAADTILSAIQKLNGNIGALVTGVSSVNGQTGVVVLTTTNIAEGTNLYYTEARVNANTNVAANTAARHAAVTLGTANGLSLSTQQLSLGLASAGVTGALSGTDWSTFNSKQNALTNPVTGTGTTNYLPKFTGTSTIGNSQIFDTGSEVRIFTTSTDARNFTLGVYGVTWDNTLFEVANSVTVFNKTDSDNGDIIGFRTVGLQRGDIRASTTSFTISSRTNLILGSNNTGQMTINTSGNVLIGTTTDVASGRRELVMRGGNGSLLSLGNNTTADRFQIVSDSGENALLNNKANTPMVFYTNNTERIRITSAGRVLIGTPPPAESTFQLDVNGTGRFSDNLRISKSSNSGSGSGFPRFIVQNTLATQGDGSSTFNFADINISSGNEAVNMFLATTFAAGTWAPAGFINVATNHELQFKTNNTTRLTLANSGAATFSSSVTATSIIRSGGTSSQFLKADGSVDSNSYYLASNPSAFIALTALSGTAPIQYNNTTGAISITQASGSTNGFLSSTDWNTFNNKTSNVGTVTSVAALTIGTTGTDLSSSVANGTTTPVITLNVPTASAANRGVLSAADWTTFNGKENAIVSGTTAQYYRGDKTFQTLNTAAVPELTNLYYTEARVSANANVAANTAARHAAVTLGTANGLSLSTQQLSLGLASSSANGALSSTDWTTFNNKQNALTNPVTGTGTANYLTKFTGTSTIGNSQIFDTGSEVRIFTTSTDARNFTLGVYGVTWDNTLFEVANSVTVFNKTDSDNGDIIGFRTVGLQRGDIRASTTSFTISSRTNLILGSNNTGQMTINTSGNVLIGTTTDVASGRRELVMRGGNGSLLSLGNNTTADRFQIVSDSGSNALLNNKANTPMILYTNNTERMRITAAGRVLIGTPPPTESTFQLDVNGTARVSGAALFNSDMFTYLNGGIFFAANGLYNSGIYGRNNGNDLVFNAGSTEKMRIISGGNVGIGTISPNALLEISKNGDLTANAPKIRINNTHTSIEVGNEYGRIEFYANDASVGGVGITGYIASEAINLGVTSALTFGNRNSGNAIEMMRLNNTGNLGIGITAPTTRLDIGNGTLTLPTLRGRTYTLSNVSSENPNFINGTGFNAIPVRVGDIIDLPFSQTRTVTAVSDTQLTVDSAWTTSFAGVNVEGRGAIVFQTNNLDRLTIAGTGNVLIGTTSDAGFKLNVNGTGRFNGNLSIGSPTASRRLSVASDGANWIGANIAGSGGTDVVVIGNLFNVATIGAHNAALNAWANLAINSDGGNVLIGTATPNGNRLRVNGTAWFDGAANATAFIPTGSTIPTNGMYLPSANTIAFSTNTTEAMRITSAGNVGVATNNPSYLFTVGQAGTTQDSVIQIASTTTGTGSIFFGDTTGTFFSSRMGGFQYSHFNDLLVFITNATEQMRILSNGNLLIGTQTDTSDKLRVNGNTFTNTIRTHTPDLETRSVAWKLGASRGGTVTTNATVRVEIDGVLVDLVARYV
jgi:hypothetical protein